MKLNTTPIAPPDWDAAKPAESFQNFAGNIHKKAKEILIRDGRHAEMFFFIPLNGIGHLILWNNNDRDLAADWLRRHIQEHYIFGVVQVVEAWMHMAAKPGDHLLKQIMAGEIKVSELKQDLRQEVLMVSAQSRDGYANSWVDRIVRDKAGKMILGECTQMADFGGKFGKVFGGDWG